MLTSASLEGAPRLQGAVVFNLYSCATVEAAEIPLDELPVEERITLSEAASMLGRSLKATEQLVARGVLRVARERDESGRTRRVWTSRSALEEYVAHHARGRVELREPEPRVSELDAVSGRSPEQRVIDQLSRENAALRLKVAELEVQLEELTAP